MTVWIISVFGWGASLLVWGAKLYRLKKEKEPVPRWMFILTLGSLVFTVISVSLLIDPIGLAPAIRWMYAVSSLGWLLATLWKGKA